MVVRAVRILFWAAIFFLGASAAQAAQVTVASHQINGWQHSNTAPRLRIFLNKPVVTSDSRVLQSGSTSNGVFYKSVTCSVAGNVLTIPEITDLDSLTDALVGSDATYSAYFYTSTGQQIGVFAGFSKFTVPPTTPTTWPAILTFNSAFVPFVDTLTYNRTQIDAKLASVNVSAQWGGIIGSLADQLDLQAALDAKQPLDADLSGLAALSTTGFISRTGPGGFVARSIAVGANLSISNPAGASGDPTISLGANVVAAVVNDTNIQGSISTNALTLIWAGTLSKPRQHAATLYSDQGNTYGAFLQDFGAASLKIPTAAGLAPTANGNVGYDSTANKYKFGQNGSTLVLVGESRTINTGTGLTGGGDLSADRTLSVVADSTTQRVEVQNNGSLVGARKTINLIPGTNITYNITDNPGSNRTDVTINGSIGSTTWSNIGNPAGNQSLTMAAFSSTWTWNATTGAGSLFNLIDTIGNVGTGFLFNADTASGSSLKPFRVGALGVDQITVSAAGVTTIRSLALTNPLTVANGGMGITSGTSGGVPYFSSSSAIASSAALTANAFVVGGGAGVAPSVLALGSANQIAGMNNAATANEYKSLVAGSAGTDFAVVHTANTVTFNIPSASASNRGLITTGSQTIAGDKTFTGAGVFSLSLDAVIKPFTESTLPTPGSQGRFAYQTDGIRGSAFDQGSLWYLPLPEINVQAFGAKFDGKVVGDASCTNGSTTVSSAGASFSSSTDVGKKLVAQGCGVAGAKLVTSINSVTDASHVVVANAASTTVSPTNMWFATDDTTAIQNAVDAAPASGAILRFPGPSGSGANSRTTGKTIVSAKIAIGDGTASTLSSKNGLHIIGAGRGRTQIGFFGAPTEVWGVFSSDPGAIFEVAGPYTDFELRGMLIHSQIGATAATSAFRSLWMHASAIRQLSLLGHAGYAIDLDTRAAPITGANVGGDDNTVEELWSAPPSGSNGGMIRVGAADSTSGATSRVQLRGLQGYSGTAATAAAIMLRFGDASTMSGITTFFQGSGKGIIATGAPSNSAYPSAVSCYNCAIQGGTGKSGTWAPLDPVMFWPYSVADAEPIPTDTGYAGVTTRGKFFYPGSNFSFQQAPMFDTMTSGSVLFSGASGLMSQDNANLFWDDSNNRLGIGTNAPAVRLHVKADAENGIQLEGATVRFALFDTFADAGVRNYAFRTSHTAFGDFGLYQSSAAGGEPVGTANRVFYINNAKSFVIGAGDAALATSATNGFLYIQTAAGGPTGTPTPFTGKVPLLYDTANSALFANNSGWLETGSRVVRTAAQFDKTSDTTLANVTGLTHNVLAGKSYRFRVVLHTTSNSSGGVKAAIAGTATATSVIYEALTIEGTAISAHTRTTTLGTAVGGVTAVAAAQVTIEGTIVVNAAGTLTVQFAQNASNGTASSVLINSSFEIRQASN
jgi:hypothetical protein